MLYKLFDEDWIVALIELEVDEEEMESAIETIKEQLPDLYTLDDLMDYLDTTGKKTEEVKPIALYF